MKKNILIGFGCAVLLLLSASVYGAQGPYISGNLGFAMLGDTDVIFPDVDEYLESFQRFVEDMGGSFNGGYSYNVESKMGVEFTAAMGYDFGNNIRIEAEVAYQKNDIDKAHYREWQEGDVPFFPFPFIVDYDRSGIDDVSGDTSSLAFLMNGYYDFANSSAFTPFVSTGIGFAKIKYNYSSEFLTHLLIEDIDEEGNVVGALDDSGDDTVIAYQLGAGVGYAVSERLTLDFKYRYFATEDPEFRDAFIEYTSHNFYIGARFGF